MNDIIEFLLYMLDGILDVVTFSRWTKWQGSKVPGVRVKREVK